MSEQFVGTWQRVCSTSAFGSFALGPDSRSYVVVEPCESGALTWRFGSTLDALRVGYTTQLLLAPPAATQAPASASGFSPLAVAFGAGAGHGELRADGAACTLTLMNAGVLVTVVYRVLDADTLAVSMTEVPSRGEAATLSQGFLFRCLGEVSPPRSGGP